MTKNKQKFNKILAFIDKNLNDSLDIKTLSTLANQSKHHFHRQFTLIYGISAAEYIKKIRLKSASYKLAYRKDTKIIDTALMSGYESSEAFPERLNSFLVKAQVNLESVPTGFYGKNNTKNLTI